MVFSSPSVTIKSWPSGSAGSTTTPSSDAGWARKPDRSWWNDIRPRAWWLSTWQFIVRPQLIKPSTADETIRAASITQRSSAVA